MKCVFCAKRKRSEKKKKWVWYGTCKGKPTFSAAIFSINQPNYLKFVKTCPMLICYLIRIVVYVLTLRAWVWAHSFLSTPAGQHLSGAHGQFSPFRIQPHPTCSPPCRFWLCSALRFGPCPHTYTRASMVCSEVKGDCVSGWLNVYFGCMWAAVELSLKNIFLSFQVGGGGKEQSGKWGRGWRVLLFHWWRKGEEVFDSLDTFFFLYIYK